MQKGDIVRIGDSSYIVEIGNQGIFQPDNAELKGLNWLIIDINLDLPAIHSCSGVVRNDTILQEVNGIRILFATERLLIMPNCPTCGRSN